MRCTRGTGFTAALLAVALLATGGRLLTGRTHGAAAEGKTKSDKELLQGTWTAVSGERDGQKLNEFQLKHWEQMIFKDDTFTREGGEKKEGTYTLDPEKEPKEIDLNLTVKCQATTWPGIYELKGNTLKLCFKPGRPTAFDSKGGVLIVFQKQQ
jgi:uncharacterized protein (TIGR03067 family)